VVAVQVRRREEGIDVVKVEWGVSVRPFGRLAQTSPTTQ
jgi:hypothetical protein